MSSRPAALRIRAQLGRDDRALRLLHAGYNDTYHLGQGPQRAALRINLHPAKPGALDAEVAWMRRLHSSPQVRDCMDLPQVLAYGTEGDGWLLASWLPGVQRNASLRPKMLHRLGQASATLHHIGRDWQPAVWHRPTLNRVWAPGPHLNLGRAEEQHLLEACASQLRPLLQELNSHPIPLHADLHQGNYRFAANARIGILDFDDSSWGHPAQDIAITDYALQTHPRQPELMAAYRAGYTAYAQWPTTPERHQALLLWRAMRLCESVSAHPSEALRARIPALWPRWVHRARKWAART